jgi:hypothetical protein
MSILLVQKCDSISLPIDYAGYERRPRLRPSLDLFRRRELRGENPGQDFSDLEAPRRLGAIAQADTAEFTGVFADPLRSDGKDLSDASSVDEVLSDSVVDLRPSSVTPGGGPPAAVDPEI